MIVANMDNQMAQPERFRLPISSALMISALAEAGLN